MYIDYYTYLRMLDDKVRRLEDRMLQAETLSQQLRDELEKKQTVHIDSVNYKVQELHVKELTGTLNIGLTALSNPEMLEQWFKPDENGGQSELQADNLSHPPSDETGANHNG